MFHLSESQRRAIEEEMDRAAEEAFRKHGIDPNEYKKIVYSALDTDLGASSSLAAFVGDDEDDD